MAERNFPQPSVMAPQARFAAAPMADTERSTFDRSHAYKTTFDSGKLIPVFLDEVLPGDTFDLNATSFVRLATPLRPFMDNLHLDIHFFFVPNRLVWDRWQEFMGERKKPTDDPSAVPYPKTAIQLSTIGLNDIANYFGIPYRPSAVNPIAVSALPFRAYALIYNEWYRDQNLIDPIDINTGDGPDTWDGAVVERRGKRHDYFTSCLPWPQKGDAVTISLGDTAPVLGIGVGSNVSWGGAISNQDQSDGSIVSYANHLVINNNVSIKGTASGTLGHPDIYADLSQAVSVSINDLRTAFQVQRLLERDARGGTRYRELIFSHFKVLSDDARLQRPEYLGGSSTRINVNPVAATVATQDIPQASLAAVGTGINRAGFTKSFTEHGYIIGIASTRADLTYQQGIERHWFRDQREEFYWPTLAHLGEQAVLNREIYASGNTTQDEQVFGYQERYAEYRYKPSRITGLMSSERNTSLDVWHLSQEFGNLPHLNKTFIEEHPPVDRVIAVTTEPHFLADFWFNLKCTRPMPVYSVPGMIDHF